MAANAKPSRRTPLVRELLKRRLWGLGGFSVVTRKKDVVAARGPGADFIAQPGREHGLAAQGPEPFEDDRQRRHGEQQQGNHRPSARLDQFQHVASSGPGPC